MVIARQLGHRSSYNRNAGVGPCPARLLPFEGLQFELIGQVPLTRHVRRQRHLFEQRKFLEDFDLAVADRTQLVKRGDIEHVPAIEFGAIHGLHRAVLYRVDESSGLAGGNAWYLRSEENLVGIRRGHAPQYVKRIHRDRFEFEGRRGNDRQIPQRAEKIRAVDGGIRLAELPHDVRNRLVGNQFQLQLGLVADEFDLRDALRRKEQILAFAARDRDSALDPSFHCRNRRFPAGTPVDDEGLSGVAFVVDRDLVVEPMKFLRPDGG